MNMRGILLIVIAAVFCAGLAGNAHASDTKIDMSGYNPECEVSIKSDGSGVTAVWKDIENNRFRVRFHTDNKKPLIAQVEVSAEPSAPWRTVTRNVNVVYTIATGRRRKDLHKNFQMNLYHDFD